MRHRAYAPTGRKTYPAEDPAHPVEMFLDGKVCKECGEGVDSHRLIYVNVNEACEDFRFCSFETGSDPTSKWARYLVRFEEPDTMEREEFEELYS